MSIEVKKLQYAYGSRQVLNGMDFTAADGRLLSVLGPNGTGKSTLFRCILGLIKGWQGEITAGGRDVSKLTERELAREIAYIPQTHYSSFSYSVFDMVLMGTTNHVSAMSAPGQRESEIAENALKRLGIEYLAPRDYTRISGGEQQLVLIARALAQQSKILIMDEPTASLDYGNQLRVLTKIRELADTGYTVMLSTHNPDQAFLFSHDILAMKDGRVLAFGQPREVVTPALIKELYRVDVELGSLCGDRLRVCIPTEIIEGMK